MALAHVGDAGTTVSKTSGMTLAHTVTATIQANNVAAVWTSWKNTDTSSGDTTRLSCADSQGNTYLKVREHTFSAGAADDGITGALFVSRVTTELATGVDTITVTSDTARTAKAVSVREFSAGAALAVEQVAVDAGGNIDPPFPLSLSGMTSREYLLLRLDASEDNGDTSYAQDADYTPITAANSAGGALVTNATINGGFRVATLTGDTCAPTASENRDRVAILAALYETAGTDKAVVPASVSADSTVSATVTVGSGGFQHLGSNIAASGTLHQVSGMISTGALAVLSVGNVGTPPNAATITDTSGKAWVLIGTDVLGSYRLSLYYATFPVGASITVSATFGASQACALSLEQGLGFDLTSPVVQVVTGVG
jgi:hypothetical protein